MPFRLRAGSVVGFSRTNQAVNLADEGRLLLFHRIEVYYAICARGCEDRATRIEGNVFCGFRKVTDLKHAVHVFGVDDLDNHITRNRERNPVPHVRYILASDGQPLPIRRQSQVADGHCAAHEHLIKRIRLKREFAHRAIFGACDKECVLGRISSYS